MPIDYPPMMTVGECLMSGGHHLHNGRCDECGHSPGRQDCECPSCRTLHPTPPMMADLRERARAAVGCDGMCSDFGHDVSCTRRAEAVGRLIAEELERMATLIAPTHYAGAHALLVNEAARWRGGERGE